MTKMLNIYLHGEMENTHPTAKLLGQNLLSFMQNKFETAETQTALALATLLDPRYKTMGFHNQVQAQASVKRLIAQCTQLMRHTLDTPPDTPIEEHPYTSAQAATVNVENPPSTGNYIIM